MPTSDADISALAGKLEVETKVRLLSGASVWTTQPAPEIGLRSMSLSDAGAPVELPWRDDVAAVLVAWFPGMEFGNALADVPVLVEPGPLVLSAGPSAGDLRASATVEVCA